METQKYLFTCYSESDYEDVDNIFLELFKHGIPNKSGKDRTSNEIDSLVSESEAVLLVISPNSMESRTVNYYLQLAEQYNKHIIPYFLYSPDTVMVPSSFYMKMDGSATSPAYEYADETSLIKRTLNELKPYFPDAFEEKKPRKKAPVIAVSCGILACILIIVGYFSIIKPRNHEKMIEHLSNATVLIYNQQDNNGEDRLFSGSGFFVNEKGLIATNYHVIEDNTHLIVHPANVPEDYYYTAEVVSYDSINDLALLQINNNYTVTDYLSLASESVKTGETIYVSGYPRGIDLTISDGIISNNRHHTDGLDYLLMTAAISPGNSGGPVVNSSGKVVGIATAKYSAAENVNLARPVSCLKELMDTVK